MTEKSASLTAINSIYNELVGCVHDGVQEPPSASGNSRPEDKSSVAAFTREGSNVSLSTISAQVEMPEAKPVRGVILELATKKQQSSGRARF